MVISPQDFQSQAKGWLDVVFALAMYGIVGYFAVSAKFESLRNSAKTDEISKRQDRHGEAIRKLGGGKVDDTQDS